MRVVNDAMGVLWPNGGQHQRVLLLVNDAAPCMIKAGKALYMFYPGMIHFTCLAHGLHYVAEAIRDSCVLTNTVVSSVTKVFLRAPLRVEKYKEVNKKLSLPPQTVLDGNIASGSHVPCNYEVV